MYSETKATTLSAYTMIDNQMVINMCAQKTEKGDVNYNVNIQSEALYQAHKKECDADIKTFKAHAEEL